MSIFKLCNEGELTKIHWAIATEEYWCFVKKSSKFWNGKKNKDSLIKISFKTNEHHEKL